jgi:hypothetical protein
MDLLYVEDPEVYLEALVEHMQLVRMQAYGDGTSAITMHQLGGHLWACRMKVSEALQPYLKEEDDLRWEVTLVPWPVKTCEVAEATYERMVRRVGEALEAYAADFLNGGERTSHGNAQYTRTLT